MSDNYNNDPQEQQTQQGYNPQPGGYNQQQGYNPQPGDYNPQQQCVYTPPQQPLSPVISMGDWLLNHLIAWIPVLGFVLLCVWAFSSTTNPTKANWAKAMLVFAVIYIILMIIMFTVMFGLIAAEVAQQNSYDQFY